ncbi:MAG: flavin reductase family protein [Candidatus Bipolaricaulota bacterium]
MTDVREFRRRQISWRDDADLLWGALSSGGAFLVVLGEDRRPNPMTVGWGQIGIVWSRPVFTAYVRESRYTHSCVQCAEAFAVSVPAPGTLREALALCGSKSGREMDKFAAAGLTPYPATAVDTAVVAECVLHYECRIVARTQQELAEIVTRDVTARFYPKGDPHLIVLGEIVSAYRTD